MKGGAQTLLYCRCGKGKVHTNGMCKICYTLKLHDTRYFNGLREAVLKRDGYCWEYAARRAGASAPSVSIIEFPACRCCT